MVALRGLAWPRLVDIDRPKLSSRSSSRSESNYVKDLVLPIESNSQGPEAFTCPVRVVSIVDHPATSSFCAELESCTPESVQRIEEAEEMAKSSPDNQLSKAEKEAMFKPDTQLPSPPESSGQDIGFDINHHLPPSPHGYDCSDFSFRPNSHEELPPLPETPLGIAQFGFVSRESFNTSVRGLLQEEPDIPIGGYRAAPVGENATLGTVAVRGKGNLNGLRGSGVQELPRLEVTSPKGDTRCYDTKVRPPLGPRSGFRSSFSNPFGKALKMDNQVHRRTGVDLPTDESCADDSGYTTAMVTAQQSLCRRENTDMSHDGARASNAKNANPHEPLPECRIIPGRDTPDGTAVYNLIGLPRGGITGQIGTFGGGQQSGAEIGVTDFATSGLATSKPLEAPNSDGLGVLNHKTGAPAVPEAPGIPAIPLAGDVPAVAALPIDATGQLPVPDTPQRLGKRKRTAKKGHTACRKCRRILMSRPILVLVVGRKLAGPVKEALKAISDGAPIEPDVRGLTEAAGIMPAPPPPIPM